MEGGAVRIRVKEYGRRGFAEGKGCVRALGWKGWRRGVGREMERHGCGEALDERIENWMAKGGS